MRASRARLAGLVTAVALVAWLGRAPRPPAIEQCASAGQPPRLQPDYAGIVLPPNIAPLNFRLLDPGRRCLVRLGDGQGHTLTVAGRRLSPWGPRGVIQFAPRAWRALLAANAGRDLYLDVCTQDAHGAWTHFDQVTNHVAAEPVDDHLV